MVSAESKHAVGVFSSRQAAEEAVNELQASGFSMDKVSVLAKHVEQGEQLGDVEMSDRIGNQYVDTTGPVGDALNAGTWGSVLVGLGSMAIPGVGYIIAAGSVGAAFLTSIAGVATSVAANNGLVQALVGLGIPEERARHYSDRLQEGYYMLMIDGTDEKLKNAEAILRERNIEYWGIYDSGKVVTS